MRRFVVGVMGAGEGAREEDVQTAFLLGELIAREGWVVLSGGRNVGIMEAVNRGAKTVAGSLTLGILPTAQADVSNFVDLVITTEMGNARNNINVLSSDVVVSCGAGGAGTASEVALAIKARRPVILLGADEASRTFFLKLGAGGVTTADSAASVIERIKEMKG